MDRRRQGAVDQMELLGVEMSASVSSVDRDRGRQPLDRRKQGVLDPESNVQLLSGESSDSGIGHFDPVHGPRRRGSRHKVGWRLACLMLLGFISVTSTILSIVSIITLERDRVLYPPAVRERMVSKIAFGSCTAYDYSPQPVWVHGVIPSEPDAWIWLGDMAYMDEPRVNCAALPSHPHCNCTSDWLHQAPYSCMAGDVDHALSRMQAQLSNPDYAQFLAYMCPGHRAKGLHPPTGTDPTICPRPIFGTYDDHDYSWDNGNKRLPRKDDVKQIFLDAIGESSTSPRRNRGRGIEWKYTLNKGHPNKEVDVFLLDERYNRDTLPCHIRRTYCEQVLSSYPHHPRRAWCNDFLHGGELGKGSCCIKDDHIYYGWCMQESNKKKSLYKEACDPRSHQFGTRSLIVDSKGNLVEATGSELLDGRDESSFCDVLGREQRLWLQESITKSTAPLKLVVSSSVLLGDLQPQMCDWNNEGTSSTCMCSGDDWECYKPAQLQLLHLLSTAPGCVVVLTGDYHYSDIRVLKPKQQIYSKYYEDVQLSYPLFQVMASGLTTSTGANFSCDDSRRDTTGMREGGPCSFVRGPSFGMIEVNWKEADPVIRLQVRDGKTGLVRLESNLTMSSCSQA
ncbi:hypothetical protein AXG93_3242s1330 [Marchantia polymorpha subsp. ruderalis]|uniref:PhoD-like phosphatase metallophosphatase domain-containing protein n=1 Tax=Marchantia polymorpha subsp. ruderalis TaxID=1480154 RepID=A0A176WIT0_MARPO|nr:hypothetical protein AXG93_3242s1330 [Marchantia polymorpha subsp. ruderalis]